MKKIIAIIILSLMTSFAFAQTTDSVLKFLGIPVDGRKSDMIVALKDKGFRYNPNTDLLVGEFNGRQSNIAVVENHGKVYRVVVFDLTGSNERTIKERYNKLIDQFENKIDKYLYITPNEPIPQNEDISIQIGLYNKQYRSVFWCNPYKEGMPKDYSGIVWFTISEEYGKYRIYLYYDNLKNQPNGEDL